MNLQAAVPVGNAASEGETMALFFYFSVSFAAYLALTAGTGTVFYFWSGEELVAGAVVSLIFAMVSYRIVPSYVLGDLVNPLKWVLAAFYMVGPFFLSLLVANIEVLYRIISGRINPAIVRVETGLKSEAGVYFFANSITLSPGTLTVNMEPETGVLYVHSLNWTKAPGEKALPGDVSDFVYFWMKLIYG